MRATINLPLPEMRPPSSRSDASRPGMATGRTALGLQMAREVMRVERVTQPGFRRIGLAPSLLVYTLPRLRRTVPLFSWGAWM
jgi:hypothetical protein